MSKKYQIKYYYQTGDSDGSYYCNDILDFEWSDLGKAKESLKMIKEHYLWYRSVTNYWEKELPEPNWHKEIDLGRSFDKSCLELVTGIILDDESFQPFSAPWCGYFESLRSAEIIITKDNDMRIDF